jgi:hypothetical protein
MSCAVFKENCRSIGEILPLFKQNCKLLSDILTLFCLLPSRNRKILNNILKMFHRNYVILSNIMGLIHKNCAIANMWQMAKCIECIALKWILTAFEENCRILNNLLTLTCQNYCKLNEILNHPKLEAHLKTRKAHPPRIEAFEPVDRNNNEKGK